MAARTASRPSGSEPEPGDGRLLRSVRTRERIVEAILELVRGGNARPTAEEVAAQAGVGARTLFRHFDDMEGLHAAVRARVEAEIRPLAAPRAFAGTPEERVRELVALRLRLFERMAPTHRAGLLVWPPSDVIAKGELQLAERLRDQLREALGPELEAAAPDLVEALDVALSYECWNRLREVQGLGRARIARLLETTALALLAGRSTPR